MSLRHPVVGILGGMGPAATADFYAKVISSTPASRDQDHLRVVIWADPHVPDRSAALVGVGPDPTPALEAGTRMLLAAGADLIAVPCNTAHAFLPPVAERTGARFVHMMDAVAADLAAGNPPPTTVGLLATTGTVRSGLYRASLAPRGMTLVVPGRAAQAAVTRAIAAVKGGDTGPAVDEALAGAAAGLVAGGAEVVVAGCTEIVLALTPAAVPVPLVDPALVLARAVVAAARAMSTP